MPRYMTFSEMRVGDNFSASETSRPAYRLLTKEALTPNEYYPQWRVTYCALNINGSPGVTRGPGVWGNESYYVFRTDAIPAPVISHLGTLAINAMGRTMYATLERPGTLDVLKEWTSWCDHQDSGDCAGFEQMISDLWGHDIDWCENCDNPEDNDTSYLINDDNRICRSCFDNYAHCDRCDTYVSREEVTYLSGLGDYCDSCREDLLHCVRCDVWYRDTDEYSVNKHLHAPCCTSPVLTFGIRNDGNPLLMNDVRTTVTLPAGVIDANGLDAIRSVLYYSHEYEYRFRWIREILDLLGDRWQTAEGNYTKRLARAAYKLAKQYVADGQWTTNDLALRGKIPADLLSQIGNIATEYSSRNSEFNIEISRDLNQTARQWGHAGSCWFGGESYGYSRCAAKNSGLFGIRTYDSPVSLGETVPTGRVWVQPLTDTGNGNLRPTFDTETASAFVVFNGYGTFAGNIISAARLLGQTAGMSYRAIDWGFSPMYINEGRAFLIAPADVIATTSSLYFEMSRHSDKYHPGNDGDAETIYTDDDCTCCSQGIGCCTCPVHNPPAN